MNTARQLPIHEIPIHEMMNTVSRNFALALTLARHEIRGRYRGSVAGMLWSFLVPLLMLGVYTFVFGAVFQARWGDDSSGSSLDFALMLFIGLINHSFLSESLMKSTGVVLANANYVKKVMFPVEILPVIQILAALFHLAVSFLVLLAFYLVVNHTLNVTLLWYFLLVLPLTVMALGFSWMAAGLTVYLRDLAQVMPLVTTLLLFLSPIFYPVSRLPEGLQPLFHANPLTFVIEQSREVIAYGNAPDFVGLAAYSVVALGVAVAGFFMFRKLKSGFADVI